VKKNDAALVALKAERAAKQKQLDELVAHAPDGQLSAADNATVVVLTANIRALDAARDARKAELRAAVAERDAEKRAEKEKRKEEKRAAAAARAAAELNGDLPGKGGVRVKREALTYRAGQRGADSYFRDIATLAVAAARKGATETHPDAALERLRRNQQEIDVELRAASVEVRNRFARFLEDNAGSVEQRVNPSTVFGQGGEFVPPLWLVSQYVPFLRPTRVAANRVQNMPLPGGIDVINLPKITVGSQTGIQAAPGGAVTSVDIQTSTVSAAVKTIAGQEDIAMQLLEQSPLAMDNVIFDDLTRDYDQRLDQQILFGNGTAGLTTGQHLGVLNVPGATSNTLGTQASYVTVASTVFHDTSTVGTQYRSILNGVNQIETLRFAPATAMWVHPRRANSWRYAAVDTQGRPLFVAYSPFNALGVDQPNVPQGYAGELAGLPVIKDANVPTTMSGTATTGGTADPIVVVKEDDLYLWEGTLRVRALPEILSGTLQIRFQVYAYSALMTGRFPASISILTGNTGLAAPGF